MFWHLNELICTFTFLAFGNYQRQGNALDSSLASQLAACWHTTASLNWHLNLHPVKWINSCFPVVVTVCVTRISLPTFTSSSTISARHRHQQQSNERNATVARGTVASLILEFCHLSLFNPSLLRWCTFLQIDGDASNEDLRSFTVSLADLCPLNCLINCCCTIASRLNGWWSVTECFCAKRKHVESDPICRRLIDNDRGHDDATMDAKVEQEVNA